LPKEWLDDEYKEYCKNKLFEEIITKVIHCNKCKKGHINDKNKCNVCDPKHCEKCISIFTDNHICKKEDMESLKFIKDNTKACPKCEVRILTNYVWCDSMLCTNCNTSFNWETLKIETTDTIHDDHYYECELSIGTIDVYFIQYSFGPNRISKPNLLSELSYFCIESARMTTHYIAKFETDYPLAYPESTDKYITNQITEEEFKNELFDNQKRIEFNHEIRNLTMIFTDAIKETVFNIIRPIYIIPTEESNLENFKKLKHIYTSWIHHSKIIFNRYEVVHTFDINKEFGRNLPFLTNIKLYI